MISKGRRRRGIQRGGWKWEERKGYRGMTSRERRGKDVRGGGRYVQCTSIHRGRSIPSYPGVGRRRSH